ncbi:MAG: hypothetical protein ACRET0_00065 [Steroidobacteraceae bacterium]
MTVRFQSILLAALALSAAFAAGAEPAPFDLAGPNLEVKVTRGKATLPIAEVPNLAAGDQLWIRADLPSTQSAHYMMVAAFLRGSTNPPPRNWFHRCETWNRRCAKGLKLTVPDGAQQVLVFLVPQTGGDFKTLVNAVRGRPGSFVRASQDLNQATLDRSRLQAYMAALHNLDGSDTAKLKEVTPLLARSLAIKLNPKCLDKIPELQISCLMQGQDSLILNDGHSTSMVEALTSGPATDLAMEASYTPQLSYGYYSPYIASVLDIARILSSFTSAQFQYIPALASQHDDQLALTLNTPPSFHNPRSVLVTALPAVEPPQLPPLHAVDPKQMYCARKTTLVLPVEGAPLVFSTGYARDLSLRLTGKGGRIIDLPASADARRGGFVVDTAGLGATDLGANIHGSLHGYWGFQDYSGPEFQLVNTQVRALSLASSDDDALIVGRENTVHLQAVSVGCIEDVMLRDPSGKELKAQWKKIKFNEVEVQLPLQEAKPGSLTLLVTQYGANHPQPLQLHAFSEAGHLDSFTIRAGDAQGILRGSRLDQVASLALKGAEFMPGKLTSAQGTDELVMQASNAQPVDALKQGNSVSARVTLKDGRAFDLDALVVAPRPSVTLIGKSVHLSSATRASNIELGAKDELPQDATLTFSVHAQTPAAFALDEKIEVATADQSFSTTLGFDNGGITLEDSQVAVATLDPIKAFGPSAFGALQFRIVADGVAGDWYPLVTLVRLPVLTDLKCPATPDLACKLSGSNLFLIDAIANDPQFAHPLQVPDGFPGYSLPVPHPNGQRLYVKLRDDPAVINPAVLVTEQLPPSPAEGARLAAQRTTAPTTDEAPPAAVSVPPSPSETAPRPASAPAAGAAPAGNAAPPDAPAPAGTPAPPPDAPQLQPRAAQAPLASRPGDAVSEPE